jgi:hypothetical protein
MLAYLNVPNIIGVNTPQANIGELKSWGTELDIKWRDKVGKWNTMLGFNISDNQNEGYVMMARICWYWRRNFNNGRICHEYCLGI